MNLKVVDILQTPSKVYVPEPQAVKEEKKLTGNQLGGKTIEVVEFCSRRGLQPLLVGSLGRAASISQYIEPINVKTRSPRDMDLFDPNYSKDRHPSLLDEVRKLAFPIGVDFAFIDKINKHGDDYYINYRDIRLPVAREVFQPFEGNLNGHPVLTLNPSTHFHIAALYGMLRPKDLSALLDFGRNIRDRDNQLPEELFEPFHEMLVLIKENYPKDVLADNIKWYLSQHLPPKIRSTLMPLTHVASALVRGKS